MPARPFWNSPVLALLFLLSSISTGIAIIMLARTLFHRRGFDSDSESSYHESGYILTASDALVIGFEIVAIFLFVMFAYLTVGDVQEAVSATLFTGDLATLFWLVVVVVVVVVGLVLPVLIELIYVMPKLLQHRNFAVPWGVEFAVAIVILAGGFHAPLRRRRRRTGHRAGRNLRWPKCRAVEISSSWAP